MPSTTLPIPTSTVLDPTPNSLEFQYLKALILAKALPL